MSIFDNNAQGKGKGLSLSDLPFNIFNGRSVDQTSWSWLNLIGQKPSIASAELQGVDYAQPRHNYYANGHFLIDQVNEGSPYTVNTTNVACMDGVRAYVVDNAGTGAFTVERAVHPDNAATKCCKISCTVINTSIAAGDYALIILPIPGNECLDLKLGTAEAESLTIQFKFKSNVLGIYGVRIGNSAGNRFYTTTIDVKSTTDTPYTIVIQMDDTGTWLYTSGIGFMIVITLMTGSTYQGTLNTWSANNILSSSAQANFLSSTSNVCYISELQMVKGTVAGEMPVADEEVDLLRCMRRLVVLGGNSNYEVFGQGFGQSTTVAIINIRLPVPMADAPTLTTGTIGNIAVWDGVTITALSGLAIDSSGTNPLELRVTATVGSGLTQFRPYHLIANITTAARIYLNRRL